MSVGILVKVEALSCRKTSCRHCGLRITDQIQKDQVVKDAAHCMKYISQVKRSIYKQQVLTQLATKTHKADSFSVC